MDHVCPTCGRCPTCGQPTFIPTFIPYIPYQKPWPDYPRPYIGDPPGWWHTHNPNIMITCGGQ